MNNKSDVQTIVLVVGSTMTNRGHSERARVGIAGNTRVGAFQDNVGTSTDLQRSQEGY